MEENNYQVALPSINETVAGSLTVFLPQSWDSSQTDGATVNYGERNGPIGMVSGTLAFSDGSTFSLSRSAPSSLEELILRNSTGAQNEVAVIATTLEDGYNWVVAFVVFDNDGADSTRSRIPTVAFRCRSPSISPQRLKARISVPHRSTSPAPSPAC